MARFNHDTKYTNGQLLDGIAQVETRNQAHDYFWELVDYYIHHSGKSAKEAIDICVVNIGYYSGYFDPETAQRVRSLFGVSHPFYAD